MKKIKVAIIGAGSAGLSARREVAKVTDDYLVFDGGILGTTCARVGCMPSKVLIHAGESIYQQSKLKEQGIHGGEKTFVKLPEVLTHVRSLRDRFVRAVNQGMSSWIDTHLVREYVSFIDENTLSAGDTTYQFEKVIIAAGTSPFVPDEFLGLESYIYTSDTIFEQIDLPHRIAVIGMGVIGLELGQALDRLGLEVTGIARRRSIAGIIDPEINEYACAHFEKVMNLNFTGVKEAQEVEGEIKLTLGDGSSIFVDKILLANGRKLNLTKLNVSSFFNIKSKKGLPAINPQTFQIEEQPHMYIAGDLTGEKQILHEASDEGKIAGHNAVRNKQEPFKTRTPLGITFSDPNIAYCGKSIQDLQNEKIEYAVGKVTFEGQGRSIIKLKEIGLLHVYGDKKTGRILGAEMFGPDTEHIAHLLSWCIQANMTVNAVLAMPFYHPVIEEGLRTALRDLRSKVDEEENILELIRIDAND